VNAALNRHAAWTLAISITRMTPLPTRSREPLACLLYHHLLSKRRLLISLRLRATLHACRCLNNIIKPALNCIIDTLRVALFA